MRILKVSPSFRALESEADLPAEGSLSLRKMLFLQIFWLLISCIVSLNRTLLNLIIILSYLLNEASPQTDKP